MREPRRRSRGAPAAKGTPRSPSAGRLLALDCVCGDLDRLRADRLSVQDAGGADDVARQDRLQHGLRPIPPGHDHLVLAGLVGVGAQECLPGAKAAVVGDAEDHIQVGVGLQHRLHHRQAFRSEDTLVAGDDLRARRDPLQRLEPAVDPVPAGLLHLVGEQRDLRLPAKLLVDPLADVLTDDLGALEVVEDLVAVHASQGVVGVAEELHPGVVRLVDQRQHGIVIERQHDHPADTLADPRVDLGDLLVDLVVGVALQDLVAARLARLQRARQ
jgi:hypothetical protein